MIPIRAPVVPPSGAPAHAHHACRWYELRDWCGRTSAVLRWTALLVMLALLPCGAAAQSSPKRPVKQPTGAVTPSCLGCGGGDQTPPSVTIAPHGGTFAVDTVTVTIGWCDDQNLSQTSRAVFLAGVAVSTTYVISGQSGCVAYAYSVATLTLASGSNSLSAQINDLAGNTGIDAATFTYAPPPPPTYTVTVGADSTPVTRASRADGLHSFTVHNTGTGATDYWLSATCPVPAFVSCAVPGAVHLDSGASKHVWASYTTGTGPTAGSLTVRAIAAADTTVSGSGSAVVNVQSPPLLALSNPQPGMLERSQCLAFGIVHDIATQCGTIRITHPLPSVRSYNRTWTPTLVYYTDGVEGPTIAVNVTPSAGITVDSVRYLVYEVHPDNTETLFPGSPDSYIGWNCSNNCTQRLATAVTWMQTGILRYHAYVQVYHNGGMADTASAIGEVAVVDRIASGFGAGWWLAGAEQLVFAQPDTAGVLWLGGDASTRKYTWARYDAAAQRAYYVAPSVTRPDTLVHDFGAGHSTMPWYRALSHGDTVFFNSYGWHVETRTRLGLTTEFAWTAGDSPTDPKLQSITLPGGLTYTYYRSPGVDSITAPGVGASRVPRNTRLYHVPVSGGYGRGISTIRDPSRDSVTFSFMPWGADYAYSGRTDRRGTYTGLDWEAYSPDLGTASTPANLTQTVVQTFRNTYAIGSAPNSAAMPLDSVYTRYTDPRGNVSKFWLNSLGAPTKITNAIGQTTTLRYDDVRFPGLVTELVASNGLVTRAWYNARGLTDSTTVFAPYRDGRNATTKLQWDPLWRMATQITQPEGNFVTRQYDPATGNRQWEEPGTDANRRVNYTYDANQELWKIQLPGTSTFTELHYDATLRNLSEVISPLGFHTMYVTDVIGRDSVLTSPVDGAALTQQRVTLYDIAGRDSVETSTGPAMNGAAQQTLTVVRNYDPEGHLLSLARTSSPDPAQIGTLTTAWRYDSLGRPVAEVAPDLKVDSTHYDLASNADVTITRRCLSITATFDSLNRLATKTTDEAAYVPRSWGLAMNFNKPPVDISHPFPRYPNSPDSGLVIPGSEQSFAYDPLGGIAEADNEDAQVHRTYFPDGQIESETLRIRTVAPLDSGGDIDHTHVYTTRYAYDRDGRRVKLQHPAQLAAVLGASGSDSTTYAYDPLTGQLQSVRVPTGSTVSFRYTVRGEPEATEVANIMLDSMNYDGDGNLALHHVQNTSAFKSGYPLGGLWRSASFDYDARGKLLSLSDTGYQGKSFTSLYSGLGHLVQSQFSQSAPLLVNDGARSYTSNESFVYDALANIVSTSDASTNADETNGKHGTFWDAYKRQNGNLTNTYATSGRLIESSGNQRADSMAYNDEGDLEFVGQPGFTNPDHTTAQKLSRASYYGADGKLAVAEWRSMPGDPAGYFESVVDQYRYDALGRRVFVRSIRNCAGKIINAQDVTPSCQASTIRRTVWDGSAELWEIQMPGGTTDPVSTLENDTAPVPQVYDGSYDFDTSPYFGLAAYTYGLALDEPIAVTRANYIDQPSRTAAAYTWPAFTLYPHWDEQGQAYVEEFTDGAVTHTATDANGVQHTLTPANALEAGWLAWDRPNYINFAWFGTLLTQKEENTGTLYRRNRYYDPSTGKFTQEDPIGLAGGLNVYGFAGGDPVSYADPFGLWPDCTPWPHCALQKTIANGGWLGKVAKAVDRIDDFIGVNKAADAGVAIRDGDWDTAIRSSAGAILDAESVGDAGELGELKLARGPGRLTNKQAAELAEYLGYKTRVRDAPFNSHGQPVFTNGRDYITPDVDSHNGGVWKVFRRNGERLTTDAVLNRIGP